MTNLMRGFARKRVEKQQTRNSLEMSAEISCVMTVIMNEELVLYSYRRCPFAIRVRMVLEEKALPYRIKEEKLSALSAELLRLHPEGKVPLLLHGSTPIYESAVITEYLDEAFPQLPLRPGSALGRAEMRLWTHWCNHQFKPDVDRWKYKFDALSEEERQVLLTRLRAHFEKLRVALKAAPYLMGESLTLADLHVFPFYRQIRKARPDFEAFFQTAEIDAWLARLTGRPSFEKVMRKPDRDPSKEPA